MFCPQCGLKQVSNDVRFCSSCGFQLNVVSGLLTTGGHLVPQAQPAGPRKLSPRQKGVRQGAMLMLSTMLVVPLVGIIGVAIMDLPGEVAFIAAVTCLVGGLLRIIYALLLEDKDVAEAPAARSPAYTPPPSMPTYMSPPAQGSALPPHAGATAGYGPRARVTTGELVQRPSVTENTTRLLKDPPDETQDR